MTSKTTMKIPALGRPLHLGTLYDCCSDTFIPGITLWEKKTLEKNMITEDQYKIDFDIIISDSTDEKINAMNIPVEMKASILAGLVEIGGSAKYLYDNKTFDQQVQVTLKYSITTQYSHLTVNHLGYQNISHHDVFYNGTATHVVTAVLYGAQAFFVFDQNVYPNENVKDKESTLKTAIEIIPEIARILQVENRKIKSTTEFICKFYGDFVLENNPVTYEDVVKVYASLPKLLRGRGVPLLVWLFPLEKLHSNATRLVRGISMSWVSNAQNTLEKLFECAKRCNDMLEAPGLSVFSATKKKVRLFQELVKQHRKLLQKEIAKVLPLIRVGRAEEDEIIRILIRESQSPFSSRRLSEFLNLKHQEMKVVNSYLHLLKEVPVIDDQTELDNVVLGSPHRFVLVFVFTSLQEEPYLADWKQCLQNPASFSPECEKKAYSSWFRDREIRRKTKQLAESFSTFAKINHSTEKTQFIAASIPDAENRGVSLYLYENGLRISTNFELPVKPPPPQITGVAHDCVELTLPPASEKRKRMTNYHIEYQVVGEDDWTTIPVSGKVEEFKVNGLEPCTEYMFRCTEVCEKGLSEKSDVSPALRTIAPVHPPEKPEAIAVESQVVYLGWQGPSIVGKQVKIKEYKIEYKKETGAVGKEREGEWHEYRTGNNKEFCVIKGLTPQTAYIFRVSAVYHNGWTSVSSVKSDPIRTCLPRNSQEFHF